MRIRKRAKISTPLHAPPSPSPCALQALVCQLNQSPWDVMTFAPPSPPYQGVGGGVFDCNGSSGRRDSAPEREKDQKLECYYEEPKMETKVASTLCCKSDGKSWKCRRETTAGRSYCKHHSSQAKSYSKKPAKVVARRAQPKKTSAVATSNPYEFYYYSGFGPRWGKKRGESSNDDSNNVDGNVKKSDDKIERAVAASRQNLDLNKCAEDDEDELNTSEAGKKRGRKPIKARSLKSLV